MSDVQTLVQKEPWRIGAGQPQNAQDPTWDKEKTARCNGSIRRESGSNWWVCEKCGRCGNHDFAKAHRPINDPAVFLAQSVQDYLSKREAQGVSREEAMYQMLHIAGVAIRYASTKDTNDLESYIQQLIVQ